MMGRRQKLIGDEIDLIRWRRMYKYLERAGTSRRLKRRMNKRYRRILKEEDRKLET